MSGGAAALRSDGWDQDVGTSSLGLRLATRYRAGAGTTVTPHASIAWQHAFGDVDPEIGLAFADTGASFRSHGAPLAEDAALIEAGVDLGLSERTSFGLSYRGSFADDVTSNGLTGRLSVKF